MIAKALLGLIGFGAFMIVFGLIVPGMVLSDGTRGLPPKERADARAAIESVETHLSSPSFYRLFTSKLRVEEVRSAKNFCGEDAHIIHLHTYFGLPSGITFRVECGAVWSLP